MTRPSLIGFGGKIRSGKDTIADHLVEHHGFSKVNMSAAIHELATELNPIVDYALIRYRDAPHSSRRRAHWFWTIANPIVEFAPVRYSTIVNRLGFTEAKEHFEVRKTLKDLGSGCRVVIDENVWTDAGHRRIAAHLAEGTSVILSGVRFPSEVKLVEELGGHTIWVERPGLPPAEGITETSVTADDFQTVVHNDGTLDELYAKAELLA